MRSRIPAHRGWPRLLLLTLLLGAAALLTASPASAETIFECTPMASDTCKNLTPIAECVWDNNNGTKTVVWGWDNPTTASAHIPVSNKNNMSPGADDQGQPTLFGPGRQQNVFFTTFTGASASWHLGNNDASTNTTTPACATKPVPQVGSIGALLLFAVVLGLGALTVVSARRRPMAIAA